MKAISGREMARLYEERGWTLRRVRGSHHHYTKAGCPQIATIPIHGSNDLPIGLQLSLMRLAGITREEIEGRE